MAGTMLLLRPVAHCNLTQTIREKIKILTITNNSILYGIHTMDYEWKEFRFYTRKDKAKHKEWYMKHTSFVIRCDHIWVSDFRKIFEMDKDWNLNKISNGIQCWSSSIEWTNGHIMIYIFYVEKSFEIPFIEITMYGFFLNKCSQRPIWKYVYEYLVISVLCWACFIWLTKMTSNQSIWVLVL